MKPLFINPIIKVLLDNVQKEFSKEVPQFTSAQYSEDDILFLNEECNKTSEFDPFNKRKVLFDKFINKQAIIVKLVSRYGSIISIIDTLDTLKDIPWILWGRILRMYSEEVNKTFRIFFLPDRTLREFPPKGEQIRPENINGGYTYTCNKETIMIYRAEDATRVLIHELMHACCLDNMSSGVDKVEAETEAWAELIYVAFLSEGKKYIFKSLLQRQSEYIRKQNKKIKEEYMKDPKSKEFPWRYTLGKEKVWKRWGILDEEDTKPLIKINNSLRLTYPPDNILKKRFNVSDNSTIL